ncbi:uncharacterized protein LOC135478042 [Liolophura sinensis]|uniref:uncharacterized protein LOC135478042 n=1 Tax=Liolophura sinensis TaxID=3198878 RepID=UPI00315993D4
MSFSIMGSSFSKAAALDFGIQWGCWVVAAALKTEKFYDLAGSSTFFLLAYQTLQWSRTQHLRQKVQSGMVMTWAVRLGLYLFSRILKDGSDSRFNYVRDQSAKFLLYWTIQGVWVYITLLPTLILNAERSDRPLGKRDYLGWAIWTLGFLIETVADYQKSCFKADPANKGQFIQSGLWSISRHPNYFGEILVWTGLYLSASSVMSGLQYASVISPLFVTFLLTKVSGIPLLERAAEKRWGHQPIYQDYVRKTAVLVPYIW